MHINRNSLSKTKTPYWIYRKSNIFSDLVSDEHLKNRVNSGAYMLVYMYATGILWLHAPPPPPSS